MPAQGEGDRLESSFTGRDPGVLMGQDVWGLEHTMRGEMWKELQLSGLERRRQKGGLAAVCKSQMGGRREDGARLFSEEHSERQRET